MIEGDKRAPRAEAWKVGDREDPGRNLVVNKGLVVSDVQVLQSTVVGFGSVFVVSNPTPPLKKGWQQFTVEDLFLNAAARETVGVEIAKLNGRSCRAKEELAALVTLWLKEPKNQQLLAKRLDDTVRGTVVDSVLSMTTGCRSQAELALASSLAAINRRVALDASEKA